MGRKSKDEASPPKRFCQGCRGKGVLQRWIPEKAEFEVSQCPNCNSEAPFVGRPPDLPSLEMMLSDVPRIAPHMAHYILSLVDRGKVSFPEPVLLALVDRAAQAAEPDPSQMPRPAFLSAPDPAPAPVKPEESSAPAEKPSEWKDDEIPF